MDTCFVIAALEAIHKSSLSRDAWSMESVRSPLWDSKEYRTAVNKCWTRRYVGGLEPYLLIGLAVCCNDYNFNHLNSNCGDFSQHVYIWNRIEVLLIKTTGNTQKMLSELVSNRTAHGYGASFGTDYDEDEDMGTEIQVSGIATKLENFPRSFKSNMALILVTKMLVERGLVG